MAAPVDAGRATTDGSTSSTSQTLNLPGSIAAGDLLLAIIRTPTAVSSIAVTGFTAISALRGADPSDDNQQLFLRTADGTEGATVSVTLGTAARMAGICWRITGGDAVANDDTANFANSTSANPNSPTYSPYGGTTTIDEHDTLWLSIGGVEGARTITTAPSSYSNSTIIANTGTTGNGQCSVYGASRGVTADVTEDPGAWTLSASDDWMIWTIAVYTAAPHAVVSQLPVEGLVEADPMGRLSQLPVEALVEADPMARLSQLPVEVLIQIPQTVLNRFRAYVID